MDKNLIGASFTVSAYEFLKVPIDQIKKYVRSRMAYQLAESLIESEKFVLKEKTGFDMGEPDKTFRIELVVLDRDEYRELLKYKEHFHSIPSHRINF